MTWTTSFPAHCIREWVAIVIFIRQGQGCFGARFLPLFIAISVAILASLKKMDMATAFVAASAENKANVDPVKEFMSK